MNILTIGALSMYHNLNKNDSAILSHQSKDENLARKRQKL